MSFHPRQCQPTLADTILNIWNDFWCRGLDAGAIVLRATPTLERFCDKNVQAGQALRLVKATAGAERWSMPIVRLVNLDYVNLGSINGILLVDPCKPQKVLSTAKTSELIPLAMSLASPTTTRVVIVFSMLL